MPEPSLTPEENLLRIIESPGQAPRGGRGMGRVRRGIDPRMQLRLFKKAALDRAHKFLTLRTANVALIAAGGLATLFLVGDFWIGLPKSDFLDSLEAEARTVDMGDLEIEPIQPLPVFLQDIITNYKVVGIIWAETPQAIIEDVDAGQTFMVSRGSMVKVARVKDILKDRVILSYDGNDIELR